MSDPFSPYWLASALGLNAAGNTGSNLSMLPPLVIHSMDYFSDPDYLKPKDNKNNVDAQREQSPTIGVQQTGLQPVTGKMVDVHGTNQQANYQLSQNHNVDALSNNYNQHTRHPDQVQTLSPVSSYQTQPSFTAPQHSSLSPLDVVQQTYQSKAPKTKKQGKGGGVRFKKWEIDILESQFAVSDKLPLASQQQLEKQLSLSGAQIRTWFKHRRQREKHVSGSKTSLANSQSNQLPFNTISSNQFPSQLLLNNHHLQSPSDVSSPHYNTSSSPLHHSSVSLQLDVPTLGSMQFLNSDTKTQKNQIEDFEGQLETIKEHDENDPI